MNIPVVITKEVRGQTRLEPERGYVDMMRVSYNVVERVVRFGKLVLFRREIDREVVPEHVKIELGVFGSTDWRSKFAGQPDLIWTKRRG